MSRSRLTVSPPLPLGVYARKPKPATRLPFPLNEPTCRLFVKGRRALWQGLQAIRSRPDDEILVPAYNCGSEVEALARANFTCRFYEATESLEPNEEELERLLGPHVRGLYLIHYFGFPQDVARWRRWCDERGLLLIEDAAQAWLSSVERRPLGSFGDVSIISLYKTFGLPDGAALVANSLPTDVIGHGSVGFPLLARRHAAWLMAKSGLLSGLGSRLDRDTDFDSDDAYQAHLQASAPNAFALGDPRRPPSSATLFLLSRVADEDAAARRRANYELLLEELAELVAPAFSQLPEGVSPFAFPVETTPKLKLLRRLAAERIKGLDVWSVPHPLIPAERFPKAASWRARIVLLPVHQELTLSDLERVATATRNPRRRGSALRLEPLDALESPDEEWTELAERSRNIFATREWMSIWWRHFGTGRPLFVKLCRSREGRLVAILPLYLWSTGPLRILRFLGHGAGDELGPICAPSDRSAAALALHQSLSRAPWRWDVFLGEHLPADACWSALPGGKMLRRHGSPVLRFQTSKWEEFLASLSSNLRQQVRRRERRLAREHELRYRLANDPRRLQNDLDTLFALHTARWTVATSAFAGAREAFHREFAACALERGWLRLWFLELDGRAVAAWYGFRFCGVESYYQAGRDPASERDSVGFVLLSHSIRQALQDGLEEYRFLRGDDQFKYRFTKDDPGLETVGISGSALGRVALAAGSATRRLPGFPAALREPFDL